MSDLQVHRWQRCRPAIATSVFSCRMSPATLLHGLPLLGKVLYLSRPVPGLPGDLPPGLLVEQLPLLPLLRTRWLAYASVITSEGPREWMDCLDEQGECCARFYLLPETDYLAWDALLASGDPAPLPARFPGSMAGTAGPAHLLSFRLRRMAGLLWLAADPVHRLSRLSDQCVRHVAMVESLRLPRPLIDY